MFIKFGDSTKKIIIKESSEQDSSNVANIVNKEEAQEYNTLYLEQDSEDRRVKALINYEKED